MTSTNVVYPESPHLVTIRLVPEGIMNERSVPFTCGGEGVLLVRLCCGVGAPGRRRATKHSTNKNKIREPDTFARPTFLLNDIIGFRGIFLILLIFRKYETIRNGFDSRKRRSPPPGRPGSPREEALRSRCPHPEESGLPECPIPAIIWYISFRFWILLKYVLT